MRLAHDTLGSLGSGLPGLRALIGIVDEAQVLRGVETFGRHPKNIHIYI